MKGLLHRILFLILCMPILFSACMDPMVPETGGGGGDGDSMIPLLIKMKDLSRLTTYGTDYPGVIDVPGSNLEDEVEDVTVYIFDNNFICEKIATVQSPFYAGYVGPIMVKTGYKNLVAVVNATSGNVTLPATEATTNYNGLLTMLTNPITTIPASPFLMTGKLSNIHLTDDYSVTSPFDTTIYVERACAKITMNVTKSNQAASHNIVLMKVAMYQGADQVALLETPILNTTTNYTIADSTTLFTPSSGLVPNKGYGYCAMADSFYTYESLCGSDKSRAVKLVIEAYVNSPSNVRRSEFYLGEYSTTPGDTTYSILRNYWYVVNVDIVKPGLDSIYVDIKACPWNLADTMKEVPGQGAEFTSALPLKLVQNFTADVLADPSKSKYAAINKHSKGASWIDVKALDGTNWELDLADGTVRNQGVVRSIDGGVTWLPFPVSGTGDGITTQRVYIYRPYKENNEPSLGPTIYAKVGGMYKEGFVIQPRDTLPIPINCFVMRPQLLGFPANETHAYIPLAGVYNVWENCLLDMLAGRICDTIPSGTIYADIAWEDNPSGVVSVPKVYHADKRDSAYIFVEAKAPGNAVVNMRVGSLSGPIFWSFHLWVTEYNPYEAAGQKIGKTTDNLNNIIHRNVFMDRNLGAMSNTFDAAGTARGLFYQFGRKDPFRVLPSYPYASQTTVSSLFRPLPVVQSTIKNPTTFYTRGSNDWSLEIENMNIWNTLGDNKTPFDPCPEGWRIPIQHDLYISPFLGSLISSITYQPDIVNGNGTNSSVLGYFPHSGCINMSAVLDSVGTNTFIWSSFTSVLEPNIGNGLYIKYISSPYSYRAGYDKFDKSYGASVRCVVDKSYIFRKESGGLFGNEVSRLKNELQ